MTDLPIILAPVRSGPAGRPDLPQSSTAAGPGRWPWWMAPARLAGRFRSPIRAASLADAQAVARLPGVLAALVPLAVIALAVAWAADRALAGTAYMEWEVNWFRLQMDSVYADVPLFLLTVCVIGALSPAAGALFVVVFGVLDMGISFGDRWESTPVPAAQLGRLVALWALWLVAAEIPALGRTFARSVPRLAANRAVGAVLVGLVTGGMTWIWTQAMPVLLRPVYVWSNLGDPARSAIMPVQLAGLAFAIAAGVVAGASTWWRRVDGLTVSLDALDVVRPPVPPWLSVAKTLIVATVLTVALGGLVYTPLDAAVLFVAFAAGGPVATLVATRTPLGGLLDRVPLLGRALLAAVLTFGLGLLAVGRLEELGGPSEFFSVVVVVAAGYVLARLVLAPGRHGSSRPEPARPSVAGVVASAVALAAGLIGLGAAAPATVLADNCASFADCWSVPFLGALVGGGLPLLAAFAMSWSPGPPPKDPFGPVPPISLWNYPKWTPPPPDKRWAEEQKRKWQEYAKQKRDFLDKKEDYYRKNQYPQMSPAARRAHDKYMKQQRDYYNQPDPPPLLSNSAKPIDSRSFPSSGAGTKG